MENSFNSLIVEFHNSGVGVTGDEIFYLIEAADVSCEIRTQIVEFFENSDGSWFSIGMLGNFIGSNMSEIDSVESDGYFGINGNTEN